MGCRQIVKTSFIARPDSAGNEILVVSDIPGSKSLRMP
jgi:hypothetical protein